jgi:Kdo2-lipid IVA lauroyltransferase/acyltransferase
MGKSSFKKMRYGLGDFFLNILLTFSLPVFRRLSPEGLASLAKIMGTIVFRLIKKYRERVIHNLSVAFGSEKDIGEIKMLAQEVFFHFTLTPLETVYLIANGLPFERFVLTINIKGKEYLEEALAKKRGVIALGAHLGAFSLLGTRLAVEGYPMNIMINQESFPKLWKRLNAYQGIVGQKIFSPKPTTTSIKKSLNCLHRNEILYLVADEQQRRGGIPVPFFGQKAFTPSGPALFSLKTGAPILPMFILRQNRIQWTLVIGHPIEIERTSDEKKDIEALTAKFTNAIEDFIRQYPNQWTWLNRRWKLPSRKGTSP